ncbi:MAG: hypothetical protein ACP5HX_11315 [Thermoproteota archaeon]
MKKLRRIIPGWEAELEDEKITFIPRLLKKTDKKVPIVKRKETEKQIYVLLLFYLKNYEEVEVFYKNEKVAELTK